MPQGIRYAPAETLQRKKEAADAAPGGRGIMGTVLDMLGMTDLTQIPTPAAVTLGPGAMKFATPFAEAEAANKAALSARKLLEPLVAKGRVSRESAAKFMQMLDEDPSLTARVPAFENVPWLDRLRGVRGSADISDRALPKVQISSGLRRPERALAHEYGVHVRDNAERGAAHGPTYANQIARFGYQGAPDEQRARAAADALGKLGFGEGLMDYLRGLLP